MCRLLCQASALLRLFWGNELLRHSPCHHQHAYFWSVEHVIPKSLIQDKTIQNDLHNLILYPTYINNARSNLKYTESSVESNTTRTTSVVFPCKNCSFPSSCINHGLTGQFVYSNDISDINHISDTGDINYNRSTKVGFVPPDLWKGQIARATKTMSSKYPQYRKLIHCKVLDSKLATKWCLSYPPTPIEMKWRNIIKDVQDEQ